MNHNNINEPKWRQSSTDIKNGGHSRPHSYNQRLWRSQARCCCLSLDMLSEIGRRHWERDSASPPRLWLKPESSSTSSASFVLKRPWWHPNTYWTHLLQLHHVLQYAALPPFPVSWNSSTTAKMLRNGLYKHKKEREIKRMSSNEETHRNLNEET